MEGNQKEASSGDKKHPGVGVAHDLGGSNRDGIASVRREEREIREYSSIGG